MFVSQPGQHFPWLHPSNDTSTCSQAESARASTTSTYSRSMAAAGAAASSCRMRTLSRHLSAQHTDQHTAAAAQPVVTTATRKPHDYRKMRFGIIGAGSIAQGSFAPALLSSEHAELVAVSRRDLSRARDFAAEHGGGCAAYSDPAALLADPRVDAVIIATPGDSHCELTLLAAKHGKHVLVEKPMAVNAAECRRMIEGCAEAGVGLAVAYRRRTWPQVVRAQQLIAQGAIGRVVCVRTHYSGGPAFTGWQLDPTAGGTMLEMAVHRIEVLLNFAAPAKPTLVTALVEQVLERKDGASIDDTDALLLRFDNGLVGVHSTIMTSPPRRDAVQIDGTEGRIIIESLESGSSEIKLESADSGKVETISVTPLGARVFDLPMVDDFVKSIAEGGYRQPICDGVSGYYVSAVVDAAFQSARTGSHQPVVQL